MQQVAPFGGRSRRAAGELIHIDRPHDNIERSLNREFA